MLAIRLTRKGKKNQPFFRVIVIDKRSSTRGGRAVEDLGYKNPLTKKISINKERVLYWLKSGAQPSATVHNLLVSEKIIEDKKIHVSKLSKKKKAEIAKAAADAKAEAEKKAEDAIAKAEADKKAKEEAEKVAKEAEQTKPEEAPVEEKPATSTESPEKAKEEKPAESPQV